MRIQIKWSSAGPAVTFQNTTRFELEHEVLVPDEVAEFLIEVVNGGGPKNEACLPVDPSSGEPCVALHGLLGINHSKDYYDLGPAIEYFRAVLADVFPVGYDDGNGKIFYVVRGRDAGKVVWVPWDMFCETRADKYYVMFDSMTAFRDLLTGDPAGLACPDDSVDGTSDDAEPDEAGITWRDAGPLLSAEDVRAFELEKGMRVPEEVARFLIEVNNGGGFTQEMQLPFIHDEDGDPLVLHGLQGINHPLYRFNINGAAESSLRRLNDAFPIGYDPRGGPFLYLRTGKDRGKIVWMTLSQLARTGLSDYLVVFNSMTEFRDYLAKRLEESRLPIEPPE